MKRKKQINFYCEKCKTEFGGTSFEQHSKSCVGFKKGIICIYMITNKIENKSYIGLARDLKQRLWAHLYYFEKGKNSKLLQETYDKWGWDSFEFKIIEKFDKIDIKLMYQREEYWTKFYKTNEIGYNINAGNSPDEETRKKISNTQKNNGTSSGSNNPMFGRSVYSIWLEKWGKEEADRREQQRKDREKISKQNRKKRGD